MENNIAENNLQVNHSKKTGLVLIITGLVLAGLLSWYLIHRAATVADYAEKLNYLNDSIFKARVGQNFAPPLQPDFLDNLYMLEDKRAFQNAREIMSRTDSVRLTIHLPDSTLRIEIKGLVVHTAKINQFKKSGALNNLPAMAKSGWLSEPFKAVKSISTIVREPIVVKHAPADTIEAQNMPETVPQPETGNVYFTWETDRNLIIHVNQVEEGKMKGFLVQRLKRNFRIFKKNAVPMLNFRKTEYEHTLELTLDKKDARIIFRALPEFPLITVRL